MIFAAFRLGVLFVWMLLLMPLQWLCVKLNLPWQRRIPVLFHHIGLKMIGVKVRAVGLPAKERPLLVCSNHASWLDIPALGSLFPLSFVARADMADWPITGTLAKLQRSIFIDRTKRTATHGATREIAERLEGGEAIVIFPEGTTSDGNRVLNFRSSLLGAAQRAMETKHHGTRIFVQPVCICYRGLHGLPMGRALQPYVAWYGDMDLAPHLFDMVKLGAIEIEIIFGEPLAFTSASDRKEMAESAEKAVRDLRSLSFSNAPAAAKQGT